MILVGVVKAVEQTSNSKINLPGTVLAWATTHLAAEIDGRVDAIYFQEGQFIKKGALLVQMRTRPLVLQRDLALAEMERTATQLKELRTGTRVETIEAAKFSAEQSRAKVNLAINELKRIKKLYEDGVLSLDEYDKAKSEYDSAKAKLAEDHAVLKELVFGPRIEKIAQAEAGLKAANAKVQIIEDDISRASIRAPFNGHIVKKQTEVGQWLEKGDPALSIIASNPLKVEVNLPQYYFNKIHVGTPGKVILESYRAGANNKTFRGKVIEKIRSGDPGSRTFPVRLKIKNKSSYLAPGMLVKVELYPEKKGKKSIFVPKDAIVRTPKEAFVWVVRREADKTMMAHKIVVKTGTLSDSLVGITFKKDKIKNGELVVVQGNERLKPKSKVKIVSQSD